MILCIGTFKGGRGRMVWEYYLEGRYADGVLFLEHECSENEEPGDGAPERFPLEGANVIMCEAKQELTPEVIGQSLVYSALAGRAGAIVLDTVVFAERGTTAMREVAAGLGLTVVVAGLDEQS